MSKSATDAKAYFAAVIQPPSLAFPMAQHVLSFEIKLKIKYKRFKDRKKRTAS